MLSLGLETKSNPWPNRKLHQRTNSNPFYKIFTRKTKERFYSAIRKLREKGNQKTITAVLSLLVERPSANVLEEIRRFLFDLKNDAAIEPLIETIGDSRFAEFKSLLISTFWQSSLDGSDHLLFFIEQAYQASYEELLEIITVIENLNGPFTEDEILNGVTILNEFMEEEDDEQKRNLLISMVEVLNQI